MSSRNCKVGDRLLQTWQEAVQRDVVLKGLDLHSLAREPRYSDFAFPASRNDRAGARRHR